MVVRRQRLREVWLLMNAKKKIGYRIKKMGTTRVYNEATQNLNVTNVNLRYTLFAEFGNDISLVN